MENSNQGTVRRAAVNGLAVVGFIGLVFGGIALAVYAARFVPTAVGNLGSAAVYFSSMFGGGEENGELEVVANETVIQFPDEELSLPSEEEQAEEEQVPSTPAPTPAAFLPTSPASTLAPAPTPTQIAVPVFSTSTTPIDPNGLPDLTVTIIERGYLASGSTNSYVKADEVPDGERGAIKFVVENKGTNVSGEWRFTAKVPTSPTYTFTSPDQKSINPGSRVQYVLGFDRAKAGNDRTITIEVDSRETVEELSENNNEDSETLIIN